MFNGTTKNRLFLKLAQDIQKLPPLQSNSSFSCNKNQNQIIIYRIYQNTDTFNPDYQKMSQSASPVGQIIKFCCFLISFGTHRIFVCLNMFHRTIITQLDAFQKSRQCF